jgi:tetratricopeptide (TPR) repeat protein
VDFLQTAGVWNDSLPKPEACWQAVVEAAILAGHDDLAAEYLKKAENRDVLLHLGDLLAARKQWDEAAERYRQAWTKQLLPEGRDRWHDPLPLYLAGYALIRAGQKKEGEKMIEQAHWVPFADSWRSYSFHRSLTQRGHKKAVELAPTNAGYLDTLAEVHFQRGDKEKAVALQKRAIELNPKKAYYQKQLKRMEAGDPAAALPPQNDE